MPSLTCAAVNESAPTVSNRRAGVCCMAAFVWRSLRIVGMTLRRSACNCCHESGSLRAMFANAEWSPPPSGAISVGSGVPISVGSGAAGPGEMSFDASSRSRADLGSGEGSFALCCQGFQSLESIAGAVPHPSPVQARLGLAPVEAEIDCDGEGEGERNRYHWPPVSAASSTLSVDPRLASFNSTLSWLSGCGGPTSPHRMSSPCRMLDFPEALGPTNTVNRSR